MTASRLCGNQQGNNANTETATWPSMNMARWISALRKTFDGFMRMVTWGAAISIGVLIFIGLANG